VSSRLDTRGRQDASPAAADPGAVCRSPPRGRDPGPSWPRTSLDGDERRLPPGQRVPCGPPLLATWCGWSASGSPTTTAKSNPPSFVCPRWSDRPPRRVAKLAAAPTLTSVPLGVGCIYPSAGKQRLRLGGTKLISGAVCREQRSDTIATRRLIRRPHPTDAILVPTASRPDRLPRRALGQAACREYSLISPCTCVRRTI
jgi:hypothetical protein